MNGLTVGDPTQATLATAAPASPAPPPTWGRVPVGYDSKEHKDLIEQVQERLRFSHSAKQERTDMARRAYKHYRAYLNRQKHQFPTYVFEPKFFGDTETLVSREMQALSQSGRLWEYQAEEDTEPETAAIATANADRHLRIRRPRAVLRDMLFARRLFGTSYGIWHWHQVRRWTGRWRDTVHQVPVQVGVDEFGQPVVQHVPVPGQEWVEGEELVIDSPWFSYIPWDEAYPDWSVSRVRDAEWFCYKTYRTKKAVEELAKAQDWDQKMLRRALDENSTEGHPLAAVESVFDWQEQVGLGGSLKMAQLADRTYLEVTEMIEPGWITVFLNQGFVVHRRRNVYGEINVLHAKNYALPGEHFGMPDFEVLEKLLVNLQDMRNASSTEALLSVFTPVVASPGADLKSIVYKPMAIWKGTSKDSITYMPRPAQGVQIAEQQQAAARAAIDTAEGISDAFRGTVTPGGDQKATALSLAVQGSGLRLQDMIDNTNDSLVVPLGDGYHQMISRFQTQDYVVRVQPGAPPQRTNIEKIRTAKLRTVPTTSSAQVMELNKKRMLELHALAVANQEPSYKRDVGFKKVAEAVAPDSAAALVKSEQEMEQERALAMQGMQTQQAVQQAEADEARADAQKSRAQAIKAEAQAQNVLSKTVSKAMGPKVEERVIEPLPDDVSELSNLIGGSVRL